jgi:hypothetical protein
VLLIVLIILALLAAVGVIGWRIYGRAMILRADIRALEAQARAGRDTDSLMALGALITRTRFDAAELRAAAAPLLPFTPRFGWVPVYGGDIAAARPLLDAAVESTAAADEAFAAFAPLLPEGAGAGPSTRPLVERVAAARPRLAPAHAANRRAADAWERVPIDSLSPEIQTQARRVDTLLPLMQGGLDLAVVAPNVLQDLQALEPYTHGLPDRAALAPLGILLSQTRADLVALERAAGPILPFTRQLGASSAYGADITAAGTLLDFAVNLSTAADEALQGLTPILAAQGEATTIEQSLAERLATARPRLQNARTALDRMAADYARLPVDKLSPPLRDGLKRIQELLPIARDTIDMALALPALLGADGRRDYLVLAQNTDELRATGGFISGAGVLSLDKGKLVEFSLGDSVAVDNLDANPYPDPPDPLTRYMNIELWLFRDSNWSPDFPTTARAAIDSYRLGRGRVVPNVIAIDPTAIQRLLAVTGPLDVEGMPEPIGDQNVIQELRTPYSMANYSGREEFKRRLFAALLKKFETDGTKLDLLALARTLRDALYERHLLLYVESPDAAKIMAARGWDGAVEPGQADYLMVVDTNMGYNKVNPNVQQQITYALNLAEPAAPAATLTVGYRHTVATQKPCIQWSLDARAPDFKADYDEWMARCYYDYLRVLVPSGTDLQGATTQPVPDAWMDNGVGDDGTVLMTEGDANTNVIGTFLVVPQASSREVVFEYNPPPSVLAREGQGWHYRLKLQKQPGTDAVPFTVHLTLPANTAVDTASPAPASNANGVLTFTGRLDADKTIDVTLRSNP